jgi:hypothetical protein
MQQVPGAECAATSDSSSASSHAVARWSRIPRVQLLRNKSDQRVPLYLDQTVPVWPDGTKQSPGSSSPRTGYGMAKAARKFVGISQTVWFRSIAGALKKTSSSQHHACNVSEVLREACACEKWSGIEQDLFTCASVDPKVFSIPSAADFISNKKSKGTSQSED